MKFADSTLFNYVKKHAFAICVIAASIWLIFCDRHSIMAIHQLNKQANEMRQEIDEFKAMVETYKQDIEVVSGDAEQMEHFAREKLHMKKPNEDVFLIED